MIQAHPELVNALLKLREIRNRRAIEEYQAAALYHIARPYDRKGARVLEIGTAFGYSASVLALAMPRATITTLNPDPAEAAQARANLARFGAQVEVVEAKSWEYLAATNDTAYDLIFCDGDHKNVRLDLPWWKHLRTDGLFIFHDYSPSGAARACPPVFRALNEFRDALARDFDVLVVDDNGTGMAGLTKRMGEDLQTEQRDLLATLNAYSTASFDMIAGLYSLAASVRNVTGAVVECGVQNGGSAATLALGIGGDRPLWLFDNFVGVPEPGLEDGGKAMQRWQLKQADGWAKGDVKTVRACLKRFGLRGAKIVSGDFAQTFADEHETGAIAVLHIDATLYTSTRQALERFYADIAPGGLVIVSAYHHWPGIQQAVHQFLDVTGEQPRMHTLEQAVSWTR